MTAAAHVFPAYTQNLGTNAQKASTDALKVALIGAGTFNWVAATEAYTTFAAFLANAGSGGGGALTEVSGTSTGYTTGGSALTGVTYTNSGLVSTLTCTSPITWTATASWSAVYAVFYDTTVTNDLVCYWDFGGASSVTSGGTFSLSVNASGLVTWTSS